MAADRLDERSMEKERRAENLMSRLKQPLHLLLVALMRTAIMVAGVRQYAPIHLMSVLIRANRKYLLMEYVAHTGILKAVNCMIDQAMLQPLH